MKSTHITFLEVMILKWKPGFKIENIWKIMAKKKEEEKLLYCIYLENSML